MDGYGYDYQKLNLAYYNYLKNELKREKIFFSDIYPARSIDYGVYMKAKNLKDYFIKLNKDKPEYKSKKNIHKIPEEFKNTFEEIPISKYRLFMNEQKQQGIKYHDALKNWKKHKMEMLFVNIFGPEKEEDKYPDELENWKKNINRNIFFD